MTQHNVPLPDLCDLPFLSVEDDPWLALDDSVNDDIAEFQRELATRSNGLAKDGPRDRQRPPLERAASAPGPFAASR